MLNTVFIHYLADFFIWSFYYLHFLTSYFYEPYPFYGTLILRLTGVVSGVARHLAASNCQSLPHRERALCFQPSTSPCRTTFLPSSTWSYRLSGQQHPSLASMMFRYSSSELRQLNPATSLGFNNPIINELGL